MENASKALIMAGGILIALLVIGALVIMFTELSDYQNATDASRKDAQIAKFNNQFEPFNKDELTLMELLSIYNKIESNNKRNPEYPIASNILDTTTNIYTKYTSPDADWTKFQVKGGNMTTQEEVKIKSKFKCTGLEYNNEGGRISAMNFAVVKDGY